MIDKISKAWRWLDKKKTMIGATALIIAKYLPPHTVAHQVLTVIGEIFSIVGVSHKIVKQDYGNIKIKEGD